MNDSYIKITTYVIMMCLIGILLSKSIIPNDLIMYYYYFLVIKSILIAICSSLITIELLKIYDSE
jgi:hypothetical protein